jgi:hypothetical protein
MHVYVRGASTLAVLTLMTFVSACSGSSSGTKATPQVSSQSKTIKPSSCASPSRGSCSARVDLVDYRADEHFVAFSASASSDATGDVTLDIRRHWSFHTFNNGAGAVGSAAITATSSRTFSTTPAPAFTASGAPLAPNTDLSTSSDAERAYSTDAAPPGYVSARSFETLVIPSGTGTQTMTATFTLNTPSPQMQIRLDAVNAGDTWAYASCTPSCTTSLVQGPGRSVMVFVNNPITGTAYTLKFTGTIANASPQPIAYKPRILFQAQYYSSSPTVFDSKYTANDPIFGGSVTYSFDEPYELNPSVHAAYGVDYQGGTGPPPQPSPSPSPRCNPDQHGDFQGNFDCKGDDHHKRAGGDDDHKQGGAGDERHEDG